MGKLWLEWDKRCEYPDGKIFNPRNERGTLENRTWDLWDDWETATLEKQWRGDIEKRGILRFLDREKLNSIKNVEDAMEKCSWFLKLIEKTISIYQGNTKQLGKIRSSPC